MVLVVVVWMGSRWARAVSLARLYSSLRPTSAGSEMVSDSAGKSSGWKDGGAVVRRVPPSGAVLSMLTTVRTPGCGLCSYSLMVYRSGVERQVLKYHLW